MKSLIAVAALLAALEAQAGHPGAPVVSLAPSGGDDTAVLQAALDAASASARPVTIVLGPGTFVTGPLHARNFRGALRGAGMGRTVLTNPATPVAVNPEFQLREPGPDNVWPAMLVFVGGDFTVADLTIHVRGEQPTTGWTVFGLWFRAYVTGIHVDGNGGPVVARLARLALEGEPAPEETNFGGVNVGNGIYFEGLIGWPRPAPTSGSFTLSDSTIRSVCSAVPVYNVRNARVRIEGNRLQSACDASDVGDSSGLDFAFVRNEVVAGSAAYLPFDICPGAPVPCGLDHATLRFVANRVTAPYGFFVDNRFNDRVTCAVVANEITADQAAVYLGAGTSHCLVVQDGVVVDQGHDNEVIHLP